MVDVVIIQPIAAHWQLVKGISHLPLGVLQAATLLDQHYDVKIIDTRIDKNWRKHLLHSLDDNPICVGVSAMTGSQIGYALEISNIVKENSDSPTVWGGPHPSILPEQTLEHPLVDYVVVGDGEKAFLDLVSALDKEKPVGRIPGVGFKKNEKPKVNPSILIDINKLPEPPYHLLDMKRYINRIHGRPRLDLEASRGCPFSCRFCYNKIMNKRKWRSLSVENMLNRVETLVSFGAKNIWFVDDNFFGDQRKIESFGRELVDRDLGINWETQGTRIDTLDRMSDKLLDLLVKSGFFVATLGVESGSPRTLKYINKGITLQQIRRVNKKLESTSIIPRYNFIVGFPYETIEDIRLTVKLILELIDENSKTEITQIACYTPYPKTEVFEDAINLGFVPPSSLEEWASYSWHNTHLPWLSDKIRHILESIYITSQFLGNKIWSSSTPDYIKVLCSIYAPLARFRLDKFFFDGMLESFFVRPLLE